MGNGSSPLCNVLLQSITLMKPDASELNPFDAQCSIKWWTHQHADTHRNRITASPSLWTAPQFAVQSHQMTASFQS